MWLAVRIALTAGLLVVLLARVDRAQMSSLMARADWRFLVAAAAIFLGKNIFGALRWRALLRSEGRPVGLGPLTRFYFVGWFYGMFLPTQTGGDVARGICLSRHDHGPVDSTVFSILIERLMGVLAIVTMGLLGLALAWDSVPPIGRWAMAGVAVAFAGGTAVMLYSPYERIVERIGRRWALGFTAKLVRFLGASKRFNSPALLAVVMVQSYLFQITSIFSTYLLAKALGAELGFGTFLVLVPLVWLAGMVPISLNGFGVREAALVMLFVPAGMDRQTATATALLMSGLVVLQAAVGGVVLLLPAAKRGEANPGHAAG